MSLVEEILTILTDYHGGYKLMRSRMSGYTGPIPSGKKKNYREIQEIKDASLRSTLSRLKKQGLINNKKGIWEIKKEGREYLKKKLGSKIPHFDHLKSKNKEKEIIVVFDIPEKKKYRRNWLRVELVALGFIPLQKSVWLGPAPLPKEFIEYLSKINLLQYLKFFKAAEAEII